MRVKHWTKLLSAVGACALGSSLQAATNIVDFNSDPALTGIYTELPGATASEWRPNGGASGAVGDGYLSLTDAKGSQAARLVFKDLENGLIVKSFKFECDLRIGGGTTAPADGFSINYASTDDPVINNGAFAGTDGETNLPEEGTQTGLGIGFDTWQSGLINGGTVQDVVGLSIRVGGRLIAQLPVPLAGTNIYLPTMPVPGSQGTNYVYDPPTYANAATNSPNFRYSMQTGALNDVNGDGVQNGTDAAIPQPAFDDPTWSLWITNLTWQHFIAEVLDNGNVKVTWKGNEITPPGGLPTGFTPIAGRLIFAARTGGSWEAQHVDNIKLTTQPFTSAVVQSVSGNASGINIQILDQGTTVLDTNTLVIKVNGAAVTPTAVVHDSATFTTKIRYNANPLLPVGTNNVQITFKDNFGVASDVTRQVIVGAYLTADTTLAIPAASLDTASSGFIVRTHQMSIGRGPGDGNRWAMAEKQLANAFIDPNTGLPYDNLAAAGTNADGTFTLPWINWEQGQTAPPRAGNFTDLGTGTQAVPDDLIPGLPGADQNNVVAEAVAYLQFPPGYYTLGVNSDDGFRVNFGRGLHGLGGQQLGIFDGGKGSSDVNFDVNIPDGGVYPVRMSWWEGGGGASCEFYYIDNVTGNHILINDVAHGSVIKAYTKATGSLPAVVRVTPEITQWFVAPDADVAAWIKDGDVTVGSVSLTVNGTAVAAAAVKTGDTTVITRVGSPTNLLLPLGNSATLVYSYTSGGNTVSVTNTWGFRVLGYGVIPAALKVPADSLAAANSPGVQAHARQIQRHVGDTGQGNNDSFPGDANLMPRPEYLLKNAYYDPTTGQPYPNVAVPNPNDNSFDFEIAGYINFNTGVANGAITAPNSGIFSPEIGSMPGLPPVGAPARTTFAENGNDNLVVEFTTYLQLKAGSTLLAFNSDDGFIAIAAANPHDTAGIRLGYFNGGRGNASPLPGPTNSETPTPATGNGNSAFAAVALEDGIYPIRILYWEGGGGVNAEFLSIDKGSGLQAMVGDVSQTFAIPSFSTSSAVADKAWAVYPPTPIQWDNSQQRDKVGLPKFYENLNDIGDSRSIYNNSDSTRPFADAEVGAVFANAAGKTIGITYDGAAVTASTRAEGTNTAVFFRPTPPDFNTNKTHTASLTYEGMTYNWSWINAAYTNVPASAVKAVSEATGAQSGFRVKTAQYATGRANTVVAAETQLADTSTNNIAIKNPSTSDGSYVTPVINFSDRRNTGGSGVDVGSFQTNAWAFWPFSKVADLPFPGVSQTPGNRDNFSCEFFAYLQFDTAGYKKFGLAGDDGFAVTVAQPGVTNGTVLFTLNRGGGVTDFPFGFTVPTPGLYPIRIVYYEGGGDANVEFFTYDDDGGKHLVNDATDAQSIKAFAGTASDNVRITSATLSGGNINITWTAGPELQGADSITGPWTGTGNTSGTASIPATGAMKFYRLFKP